MKKLLLTVILSTFTFVGGFSQILSNVLNTTAGGTISLSEKTGKKESGSATGSPYVINAFTLGTINGIAETMLMKYNAYADEIEIDNGDGKVFILPKSNDFNVITLKTGVVYKYHDYTDVKGSNVQGYLIEKATKNNVTLLKKEKILLMPERHPVNGYENYVPPKFERVDDEFYLQLKNKSIVSFPKSKKKLQELFPNQKTEIETYLKANDLSFKKENDMIKIAEFVATLS